MTKSDGPVFRQLTVNEIMGVSETYPVNLSVEVLRSQFTIDAPAKIRVSLEWTGSSDAILMFGMTVPIELPKFGDGPPPSLLLVSPERNVDRDDSEPECWRHDLDPDYSIGHFLGASKRNVAPGDILSCDIEVWGDYRSPDSCLPTGKYMFTDTVSVKNKEPSYKEWSFELQVTDPRQDS